jgi:hypothetical protein
MEKNGSPDPSFETDDNLDYFLAIIPINPLSDGFIKIIRETYTEEILKDIIKTTEKGGSTQDGCIFLHKPVLRQFWGNIIPFEIESPSSLIMQSLPCHTSDLLYF